MIKTVSKVVLFISLITLLGALYLDHSGTFNFSVTEVEAQTAIDNRLKDQPLLVQKFGVKITPTEAKIDFLGSEHAKAKLSVFYKANGYSMTGQGKLKVESSIHYQSGEVFLRDLHVLEHEFTFDDPKKIDEVKQLAKGVLDALASKLSDRNSDAYQDVLQSASERYITQIKEQAATKAIAMLESKPVYSLHGKDAKQSLIAMSVKSIRTDENAAHVGLSITQLLSTLTLYMIAGLLALVAAIGLLFSGRSGLIVLSSGV